MTISRKVSVLTTVIALALAGPAAAGGSHKSAPQHFDWNSTQPVKVSWTAVERKKKEGLVLRISGRSRFACSPSGFGRSSRCFRK